MGVENQSYQQQNRLFALPLKTLLMEHIRFYIFLLIFSQSQSTHQMIGHFQDLRNHQNYLHIVRFHIHPHKFEFIL